MNPEDVTENTNPAEVSQASNVSVLFDQMAEKIIELQESIIGPIAIQQAKQVSELNIDWSAHTVGVNGDPKLAIDELVEQYKFLFGQIAVETCKEAASKYLAQLPPDQLPKSLQ